MTPRSRLSIALVALSPLAVASAVPACSSASSTLSTKPTSDAGTSDASPRKDGATSDAGTCNAHPAAGYSIVSAVPSADPRPDSFGEQVAMALDENDDPMFAYFTRSTAGSADLYFVRWDPCAGAFTAPLLVDGNLGAVGSNSGEREIAIAYDASTQEIGIAYMEQSDPSSAGDGNQYTKLATRKGSATSFTTQVVSTGLDAVSSTAFPGIAMTGGNIYIEYIQGNHNCGGSCTGVVFLTSTSTAPDGGASTDGGPPPPHYFLEQNIQFNGGPALAANRPTSIAVDGSGRVGVAYYEPPATGYTMTMMYWRNDLASAVAATDSNNVQNDYCDVSLAYDGTKPRIAGHLVADTSVTYNLTFVSSADGVTWNPAVKVDVGTTTGTDTWLAMDGNGNAAIVASGRGNCMAEPYVARTTDDGVTWTSCMPEISAMHTFSDDSTTAAYGASRIKGKLVIGFQNSHTNQTPGEPNGVWFYASP
jgi:hypothetical protein